MKPDRHAVVAVIHGGEVDMRPALFVFTAPDGFAWVEPGYLEPAEVPRPAFYRVRGVLTLSAAGFSCDGEDGRTYVVGAISDLEVGPNQDNDIKRVCDWAEGQLKATGSSMDAERDRLKAELGDALA